MKIPQICYTKKFKIGVAIGVGIVVGTEIADLCIKAIQRKRLEVCCISLQKKDEQ